MDEIPPRLMFIHGQESNSQGFKATLLRKIFPEIVIPDFTGTLAERMDQLRPILRGYPRWRIIGSRFGG